jgi:predicted metal-dependent hydrolase
MWLYMSQELKLLPGEQEQRERVRLIGARLCVKAGQQARNWLIQWYRERARQRLDARVPIWAERVGVYPVSVLVRAQRTRWGSADARGNLRFNWRIVQASTRLFDYVVAHELVHLLHPDHTRDFWATLGRLMPDYETRREKLRVIGRAMVW